ncbi:hypothetical protein [Sphingorhabdus sp. Alg231-15]|uniref:hypothetical protein n=1 Tax=Sphingorhabdus sp. Alg231-15 TaxID=1922222 RepID=UPI000D55E2A8
MKLLAIIMGAILFAGTAGAETMPASKAEAIGAQEETWAAALLAADLETVATLMHRDFRLVRSYGNAPPISQIAKGPYRAKMDE